MGLGCNKNVSDKVVNDSICLQTTFVASNSIRGNKRPTPRYQNI